MHTRQNRALAARARNAISGTLSFMPHRVLVPIFLIFSASAFAQLDSNSITVTASRSFNLQPDLAVISITVNADSRATLSDVLAAVQPAGIAISNLTGVGTGSSTPFQTTVQWFFSLTTPITSLKETTSALSTLAGTFGQSNPNLKGSLAFQISGTQISAAASQSQPCTTSDLLNDARNKAAGMAAASGRTLGPPLAIAGAAAQTSAPQGCSITVKFGLQD
jgi:hypothetical protein